MWKEQEVLATVIGVDKSAGVRKADGTLNDSWCRVGYLWTLNLRPTEQARTLLFPSWSAGKKITSMLLFLLGCIPEQITKNLITTSKSALWLKCNPLHFCVINSVYSLFLYLHLSAPAPLFSASLSGRAQCALVEAQVDGHHSAWNGGLCLSCLPPLSHHHLLQGYQEVRPHSSLFSPVEIIFQFMYLMTKLKQKSLRSLKCNVTHQRTVALLLSC